MNPQANLDQIVTALSQTDNIQRTLKAFTIESDDDPYWADMRDVYGALSLLRHSLFALENRLLARVFEDWTNG